MFDIRWIREHPEEFDRGMARRGLQPQAARLIALDEERRKILTELQELQNRRNALSKQIGQAMARGDKARAEELKHQVAAMKARIQELEDMAREKEAELRAALAALPNIPRDEVPDGEDESANRRRTKPDFPFR